MRAQTVSQLERGEGVRNRRRLQWSLSPLRLQRLLVCSDGHSVALDGPEPRCREEQRACQDSDWKMEQRKGWRGYPECQRKGIGEDISLLRGAWAS